MSGLPTACALGAFAVIARRSGELPPVTVVLAVVADGAHVLLLASFVVGTGFLSLEGQVVTVVPGLLFAWILATGLALLRRPSAPRRLGPAGVRPRAAS
ncbi:hypothetical protein SAMN05443575_2723 [Jatrophihabitans endophyticus]|uniref:Uncharacterized protein n=2 Tax=Jatrophihabitans endophyticus TaxID=1206085 RepID=A0A1M5MGI4_9ACTN|nr:hypothetical protein SAMN05443575_2723 [Jatrophihabitans endophyticus]